MKKIRTFIAIVCFALTGIASAQQTPRLTAGDIGAKAFILVDANSQRVLAHERATEHLDPASITKLMTAYATYKALEKGKLTMDDITIISANVRNMTEGSRMFLERGSRVSIRDLLHGLVIQSGNDAAVALAEAVSGSEEKFVALMNQYAKALGMTNSHFKNVTGLTEPGHYMSARDIATLAHAIISEFPEHYKLYKEKSFTWNNISQGNRNVLLLTDPSVDGLKTGYTEAAGYCLTTSAKRDNMRLISVVLGTKSAKARVVASRKVLNYGFNHFVERTLITANKKMTNHAVENGTLATIDIAAKNNIRLPVSRDEQKRLNAQLVMNQTPQAPISAGQVVGEIQLKIGDKVLASTPAISLTKVERVGFFTRLYRKWFN
ncbi:MAG: serine-type D-Ala-D-Ala carboxypeptidase [Gammaproteobacteria bacterium]|nr:MAG: serine-type D-Ala-D-Ala carboxypeptidase [Gammaproteobacteria bacterium]